MVAPFIDRVKRQDVYYYTLDGSARLARRLDTQGKSQQVPYVNTAYTAELLELLQNDTGNESCASWAVTPGGQPDTVEATNQARARFVGRLGDSSSFGATLTAERRETFGMIVSVVTKTLLSAKAVSRGNLVRAANILGVLPPEEREVVRLRKPKGGKRRIKVIRKRLVLPDGRTVVKSMGSYWLWWSYGVKPLMEDIYNGMDVLQRPTPGTKVTGSGSGSYTWVANDSAYLRDTYVFESKVRISAVVSVSNPNLWLANQLGLVNPAQWLLEGIPFSFVVDWFSNLSQVVSQLTDFVGLDIAEPVTSSKCSVTFTRLAKFAGKTTVMKRTMFSRQLVIPQAKLRFAYERFQWQRGANAISLLVQFLSNKRGS